LDAAPPARCLAQVARELNASNTAFLARRSGERLDGFHARFFTTCGLELQLCGHASLAAAHVLWTTGVAPPTQMLRLHTLSGVVTCTMQGMAAQSDALGPVVAADMPALPVAETQQPGLAVVQAALGPDAPLPIWVGAVADTGDVFVVLESPDAVRRLQPNMGAMAQLSVRGVIVTAAVHAGDGAMMGPQWAHGAHFVSRFYAPRIGIDEDALTGSAHCALAPFWAARLGVDVLTGFQASDRGGLIAMQLSGQPPQQRVALIGRCATTLRGEVIATEDTSMRA
jgi:PhzF family phenazine biosynthesis protein